ncbi:unnamed protein product, partial [Closterium sp. Yama58-4]
MARVTMKKRAVIATPLLLLLLPLFHATLLSRHLVSASAAVAAGAGRWRGASARPWRGAAASGACSLVSCPSGCSCSDSSGVAKCSCSDPCYGVKCPDVSKCAVQNGAAVCKCPAPFKRLINNQCSSAALPNSDYLDEHNAARAAVGAVPLVWDDALAARARAWARTLTTSEHNCRLQHGGNSGEGQNLSGAGPSGWASNGDAVRWWVDEAKWYQLGVFPNGCAGGDWAKCGHYTQPPRAFFALWVWRGAWAWAWAWARVQVVWNNTRRLGCAKASCGTSRDVWACHYSPQGNFIGQLPYVQDPCFRVLCPSTATCRAVGGKPTCQCPQGQALVNGKCQAAPSCKGVTCPASARCRADSNGIPFCACPASQSLVIGACIQSPSTSVTTSIALFNRPSFTNSPSSLAPTILRAPPPGAARPAGCVNVPAPMAGAVGSLKILWDAPDGATGSRAVCGLMWFWNGADCYGRATGWPRPGNNVTTAA